MPFGQGHFFLSLTKNFLAPPLLINCKWSDGKRIDIHSLRYQQPNTDIVWKYNLKIWMQIDNQKASEQKIDR